jgi:peroxiredoxin
VYQPGVGHFSSSDVFVNLSAPYPPPAERMLESLSMKVLRFSLALTLWAALASSQDVDPIARRIQEFAAKEPLARGIETELRAASLLRQTRPELAAAFLESGKRRLAAHPDIQPTKWMVTSLLALDPEHGEGAILQHASSAAFDALLQYYFSSDRMDRGVAVLQKAVRYEGPRVTYVPTAIQKLIPLDPVAAADAYFTLRESPRLASRYPRLPVVFSEALPHVAAAHPDAVHTVLSRLFPLFDDETFLTNVPVSITARVGGTEVRTKNARETVLLRLGALARVAVPEEYARNEKRFDLRVASVKNLDEVLLIADAHPEGNGPQKSGFDFAKEPAESAVTEWRKMTQLGPRDVAAGTLLGRADLSPAQKRAVMNEMIAFIRAAQKQDRAGAADDLIWWADKAGLDRQTIRPAVELLVNAAPDSSYPVDDEAVLVMRQYGFELGQNDPSIQARVALAQLEQVLSDRYTFTLPSLDGTSTRLNDLRGKVVLLNFWATWCGPCRAEKPILQKVYGDLKEKGLVLLAITDEDPATVRHFVNEYHLTLPVFIDRTRTVFDHYLVEGIPKTIILDRRGRAVAWPITISDEGELRRALAAAGVTP